MTIMSSTSLSLGLDSVTNKSYLLHFLQLLSTCMAFFLVTRESTWSVDISNWSMFVWCFCFAVTLLILIAELCGLQDKLHFWDSFLITSACYCALFCLSASIIYSITYVQFMPYGPYWDRAIAATAFSCIASVLYVIEVTWMWYWYDLEQIFFYKNTMSATSEKATQVEKSCGRWRQQHTPNTASPSGDVHRVDMGL